MAKTDTARQKRRIVFSIFVLALVTLTLVSTSLAWFLTGKGTEVNSFGVQTDGAYNLQVSPTDEDNWSYELVFHDEHRLHPVAGNGVDFFTPVYEQAEVPEGSGVFYSRPASYVSVPQGDLPEYVFPVDFKVLIESDCDLFIDELFVEMPEKRNTNFETTSRGISQTALLGAVRLAVLQKTEDGYTPCFYWMPDQTSELQTNDDGKYIYGTRDRDFEGFTFQNGTTLEDVTVVLPPAEGEEAEDESGKPVRFGGSESYGSEGGVRTRRVSCDMNGGKLPLTSLTGMEEAEFRVVVWLDGNDNECNNVLMGGDIHVGMKLSVDIE